MRVAPQRLKQHLAGPLLPVYLVFGQEPLLIEEDCDRIRSALRDAGCQERIRLDAERGFDWSRLTQSAQAMSLFATRQLIDLRLPSAKPGDAGARALVEFAEAATDTTVLLISTGRIERRAQSSRWFKALDAAGATVEHSLVGADKLPAWIKQRLDSAALSYEPSVVPHLSYLFEGNLLAAAQEISKLALLVGERRLVTADIDAMVSDQARFNVYGLVDACLAGDPARSTRMLFGLRREGIEPLLVSWALAREARTLATISHDLAAGRNKAQVFKSFNVWSSRVRLVEGALRRAPPEFWLRTMQALARLDRVIKGRESGTMGVGMWGELEQIILSMSGLPPASQT